MRSLLIVSFSNLDRDPRVWRQIALLSRSYQVTALGYSDPGVEGVEFIGVAVNRPLHKRLWGGFLLKAGCFERYYWSLAHVQEAYHKLAGRYFDLVIANDLNALPLSMKVADGKMKLVFDAHEYAPLEFEDNFIWRFFYQRYSEAMCSKYLPRMDGMMTVCQGIADEFRRNFGVAPEVVMNTPDYHDLQPSSCDPNTVRMIHHGVAIPSRRLELMIETVRLLDQRFRLDFMLMPGPAGYLDKLKHMAADDERINFICTVPMPDIPAFCNRYDIGIFLLPLTNFNYAHALPNKLFEFIQARLAVAIGPSPEMARLVRQFDCGVVAEDFTPQALAAKLNDMTAEKISYYKQRSGLAARELCYENSGKQMQALLETVMEQRKT